MAKKESNNILGVILLIIIWVALSVRFMLRFYSFYYIIPIRAELVWVFKDDKMVTSSLVFWIIWIVVWIIMLLYLIKLKKNKDRLKLWIWAIIFWLIINFLFYVINPWYTLQTHPRLFFYQDWKNITNKERYFFLTERYGYDYTLYKPFKTLKDSIDGLEFAKRTNETWLYNYVFYDLEKYWYDKVLNIYKDKTFQAYLLDKISYINKTDSDEIQFLKRNIKYLDYLEKNWLDNIIIVISKHIKQEYDRYKKWEITEDNFFDQINNYRIVDFHDKLDDIKWIHQWMFWNDNKLYKYIKNQNWDRELINGNNN